MKSNSNVQIQLRTTEETRAWLKELADKEERSVNWMLNKIVNEAKVAAQARQDAVHQ